MTEHAKPEDIAAHNELASNHFTCAVDVLKNKVPLEFDLVVSCSAKTMPQLPHKREDRRSEIIAERERLKSHLKDEGYVVLDNHSGHPETMESGCRMRTPEGVSEAQMMQTVKSYFTPETRWQDTVAAKTGAATGRRQ